MLSLRIPATTANLGPGMDVFGMALNLYNIITVEPAQSMEIKIIGYGDNLPTDKSNLFYQVLEKLYKHANADMPTLAITLENNIPPGKGLGSSAAVIVGALITGNTLLGRPLGFDALLKLACKIEGHPDNIAPALLGGIVIAIESGEEIITHSFEPPQGLRMVAAIPNFELPTKQARHVLPENVSLKDAIYNVGRAALVTAALKDSDFKLLSRVLEDKLHQQYRTVLIPGMEDVFQAAKEAGAIGAVLSGAGPTLIAFTDGREEEIGLAMQNAFLKHGVNAEIKYLQPCLTGAEILD